MTENKVFERGKGDWDKLCDFMDQYEFSCADFLAVVCAHLLDDPQSEFETELMVDWREFKIRIEKK